MARRSPLDANDSDATVAALLSFLSLQPGDTDREHFEDYSLRQMQWVEGHADELGFLCFEMEEALASARGRPGEDSSCDLPRRSNQL